MALNWAMLSNSRTPVPLPNEMTITSIDSGVDILVMIPPEGAVPSGPSSSSSAASSRPAAAAAGGAGTTQKLKALGKVWLTDMRFIFVAEPNASFDTLSVPLHSILSTGFHQPTLGSNYLTFQLKPSPDGNLTEGTSVEIRFKNRAMFEFVSLLDKTRERSIYMARQAAEEDEGLPSYTSPAESSSVTMIGGVPVENPPGYND